MEYLTKNHSKYLLQYHIIFVVKYRLKIIDQFPIKEILSQLSINDDYIIKVMEVDKDHIHLLIQAEPKISPLYIVKKLKGKSTMILWKDYSQILKRFFWKERTFWSDGYFISSIGNVSEHTLHKFHINLIRSKTLYKSKNYSYMYCRYSYKLFIFPHVRLNLSVISRIIQELI